MSQRVIAGSGGPWPAIFDESGNRQVIQSGFLADEAAVVSVAVTAAAGKLAPHSTAATAGVTAAATAILGSLSSFGGLPSLTVGQSARAVAGLGRLGGRTPTVTIPFLATATSGAITWMGRTGSDAAGASALVTTGAWRVSGAAGVLSVGASLTISPQVLALFGATGTARADTAIPVSATASAGTLRIRSSPATWFARAQIRQSIAIGWPDPNFVIELGAPSQILIPGQLLNLNASLTSQFAIASAGRLAARGKNAIASLPAVVTASAAARLSLTGNSARAAVTITARASAGLLALSARPTQSAAGASSTARPGGMGTRSAAAAPHAGAFTTAFLQALALQGLTGDAGTAVITRAGAGRFQVSALTGTSLAAALAAATAADMRLRSLPVIVSTGRLVVSAQLGAALLLGHAPTLFAGAIAETSLGAIALTGQLATVQVGGAASVTATVGSMRVLAQAAGASAGWFGTAGSAAMLGGGTPASLAAEATAFPGAGLLALHGKRADAGSGLTITADPGLLAWQGSVPDLVIATRAVARLGAMRIRSQPVALSGISAIAAAGSGRLRARGAVPAVLPGIVTAGVTLSLAIDERARAMASADFDPTLNPLPLDYGAMSVADSDKAFIMDAASALAARADTLVAVGAPSIRREDGDTLTPADLTAQNVGLLGNTRIAWTFTGNGNTGVYYAAFPLTLASGSRLTRSVRIAVLPDIG